MGSRHMAGRRGLSGPASGRHRRTDDGADRAGSTARWPRPPVP